MANVKKINWLLILQGWAMLWVVIGHANLEQLGSGPSWETGLVKFAYSFHMPLFMFVSGWLFYLTRLNNKNGIGKRWTYINIIKDKVIRLLLPGVVFSIFAFILKSFFQEEMARQTGFSFVEIIHAYIYPADNPFREIWFIVTLFAFFLLTPVWRLLIKQKCRMLVGLIVMILFYYYHPTTQFLCIDCIFRYSIWFYLGLITSKEELIEEFLKNQPLLILLLGIIVYIVGLFLDSFLTIIGGITLSLGLALLADVHVPLLFTEFRNYTYQIFLMGIFVQIAVKILYRHVAMPYVGAFLLCILVGLYLPVLFSKIIEKINWKPLSLCVGIKI